VDCGLWYDALVLPKSNKFLACVVVLCAVVQVSSAGDLDTIGATLLWQLDPTLKGEGVPVVQAEAEGTAAPPDFEVNPAAVGQPASLFTWISSLGSASSYPNTVGSESFHGNLVGANFFGLTSGAAPQVSHVENYEANYFLGNIIFGTTQPSIGGRVVNQSWIDPGQDSLLDPAYDNYAARYGTIFCSGVGNSGIVAPPGTCYNGLGVGVYGTSSSVGPTPDGRCKPDLVAPDAAQAPASANSFSIPYAAGAAAVLVQAANRGDGGSNTNATDLRTIKALLLNGAVKPANWTNSTTSPLDFRYGAGILNLFNSWNQLKGGHHSWIESTSSNPGTPHPPGTNPNNEPALTGWDYNSITNAGNGPNLSDQVNHYYFLVTNTSTLTATLVWNRQQSKTSINDLNLFLYETATSNLVASSVSSVDNVEQIFLTTLLAGRYDLQVQKAASSRVSPAETYALAFEFFHLRLSLILSNSGLVLSWPIAPTGFRPFASPSLTSPTWAPLNVASTISNGQNVVSLPISPGDQFFRLQRP
jgi:Subtilase family